MESVFNNGGIIGADYNFNTADQFILDEFISTIEYVGGIAITLTTSSGMVVDLTTLTGGTGTAPQPGDLVIAYMVTPGTTRYSISNISGFTNATLQYVNDSYDTTARVAFKIMGATPDTSATFFSTGISSYLTSIAIQVWRGVNTANFSLANISYSQSGNSMLANPPLVNPTIPGTVIIGMGAASHRSTQYTGFASSDLTNFITSSGHSQYGSIIGMGSALWSGSGSFDPAAFTLLTGSTSTASSWAAASVILEPLTNITYGNRKNSGIWNLKSAQLAAKARIGVVQYTDTNTSLATQAIGTAGYIDVSPDGTKLFLLDDAADAIYRYDMSTPWDITTISSVVNSLLLPAGSIYLGFDIDDTGTYVYYCTTTTLSSGSIVRYTLTTPWDLSTATSPITLTNTSRAPTGVGVSPDGNYLVYQGYNGTATGHALYLLTLSTPYDITSITNTQILATSSFILGNIDVASDGIEFAGLRNPSSAIQFRMTSPWSLSTLYEYSAVTLTGGEGSFKISNDGSLLLTSLSSNNLATYQIGIYK